MGEAKRRKNAMGENYGQETPILPWVPITKSQAELFCENNHSGSMDWYWNYGSYMGDYPFYRTRFWMVASSSLG